MVWTVRDRSGEYCAVATRGTRQPCAGGTFASDVGRSTPCTAPCVAGYYCPPGSSSGTNNLTACTAVTSYCPAGSPSPVTVTVGYYSIASSDGAGVYVAQAVCVAGTYCVAGVQLPCLPGHSCSVDGMSAVEGAVCPPGRYSGAGASQCSLCPAGRYGDSYGLPSSDCSGKANAGLWTRHARRFLCVLRIALPVVVAAVVETSRYVHVVITV